MSPNLNSTEGAPQLRCLKTLYAAIKPASDAFDAACVACGYADRWDAYHRQDKGDNWPESVALACDAETKALHAYYSARDGDKGFLGSRGL